MYIKLSVCQIQGQITTVLTNLFDIVLFTKELIINYSDTNVNISLALCYSTIVSLHKHDILNVPLKTKLRMNVNEAAGESKSTSTSLFATHMHTKLHKINTNKVEQGKGWAKKSEVGNKSSGHSDAICKNAL